MPWNAVRTVELDPTISQSFLPNNLACDGNGRFAFIHGTRVQCTRQIHTSSGRADFTLAYSEDVDVTGVYWWRGLAKYGRPLLVLTTDSTEKSPATVQIWNAWRGTGSRIFRSNFNCLDSNGKREATGPKEAAEHSTCEGSIVGNEGPQFVRGISQASSSPSGQLLFCGASTGAVFGIMHSEGRGGGFEHVCTLVDLTAPVSALGGDREATDLLAGADETGNMVVWRIEEDLDGDGGSAGSSGYSVDIVYKCSLEGDYVTCLGIRDSAVIAGHLSGVVTFHDVDVGAIVARAVTNVSAVTCLDVCLSRNLVLVCGEDCRASVLGFPAQRSSKPVVHLSLTLSTAITGCAVTTTKEGFPGIALLLWNQAKIIRYEYQRQPRGTRRRPGADSDSPVSSRFFRASSRESVATLASRFSARRRSFESSNSSGSHSSSSSTRSASPPRE
jgi:hypothetical protein